MGTTSVLFDWVGSYSVRQLDKKRGLHVAFPDADEFGKNGFVV
jgi:hypothetical protein